MHTPRSEQLICDAHRDQLDKVFALSKVGFRAAETPEEMANESERIELQWDALKEACWSVVKAALYDDAPRARTRSQMIEDAIAEMVAKLIEYPSTPYTKDCVESLTGALNALEVSMRIDRADAKAE